MAGDVAGAAKAVADNPQLLDKLKGASSPEAKRAVLNEAGFSGFTPEQADALRKKQQGAELTDEDLSRIAGGSNTSSTVTHVVSEVSEAACEDVAEALA